MNISVAIPSTSGGGAEVFTRQFCKYLHTTGDLSRLYTAFGDSYFNGKSVTLGELRAGKALFSFWRQSSNDCARSYLLTLGYINFATCLLFKRQKINIVVRICNPPSEEMKLLTRTQSIRYWLSTRLSCAIADQIIVQSEHMKSSMLSARLASEKKISVIHNPVSEKNWETRNTTKPLNVPYILCASTNKPQKDLPTLISAFASIQNLTDRHLVLAGVSPDDPLILMSIKENNVDSGRVHCIGFVDEVFAYIEHADICALPSLFEGFSNFLLESGSYGKKIVATDCPGGNVDFFSRYPNHTIVPVRDTTALGAALLAESNDLQIDEAKWFLKDFSADLIYRKYLNLLGHCD